MSAVLDPEVWRGLTWRPESVLWQKLVGPDRCPPRPYACDDGRSPCAGTAARCGA